MKFNALPQAVQDVFNNDPDFDLSDVPYINFVQKQQAGYNNLYPVPYLQYDFDTSNYDVYTVNLAQVSALNAGAASSKIFEKQDTNQDAWIVVHYPDSDGGKIF